MTREELIKVLSDLKEGEIDIDVALDALEKDSDFVLKRMGVEDIGFAKLDHSREQRQGIPEVVLGGSKTPEQVAIITEKLYRKNGRVLVTHAGREHFTAVKKNLPESVYFEDARVIVAGSFPEPKNKERFVLIVSAGTSDIPVAKEADLSARFMALKTENLYDVGVAGIHRLLAHAEMLREASVCIVVAGMEGALASVVGGLVSVPVIAVPTSVGYGASFGGLSALLAMLNSCVPGVATVNIDNGFGAAMLAYKILSLQTRRV